MFKRILLLLLVLIIVNTGSAWAAEATEDIDRSTGAEWYLKRNMRQPDPENYEHKEFKSKFLSNEIDRTNLSVNESSPKVVVYIFLDPIGVPDPVKSTETVYNAIKAELDATKQVNVIPLEISNKILRSYIRENTTADTTRKNDQGFLPKRSDLMTLLESAKADYVLFMNVRLTSQEAKFNFWVGMIAQRTIMTDVLLIGKNQTEYIIDEAFSDKDSSASSFERAYRKALQKVLEKIDLSKVDFVPIS